MPGRKPRPDTPQALNAMFDIVIDILLPVFGIVGMGYGAARLGWFPTAAEDGVSRFVFSFAVPFMLFRTLATTDLPESVPWALFASYYLPAYTIYALGFVIARYGFGRDPAGAILTGMGCAFANTVLLGLPIILLAYGEEGALPFFLILSVHGLTLFTFTTILLEVARNRGEGLAAMPKQVAIGLARNPILIGLALGLAVNFAGIGLATPVERISATMQGAVLPCALFVLGASLRRYGIAGRLRQSSVMVALKLAVFPAMVYCAGRFVFDLPLQWVEIATLTAAQPTGVMVYLFAQRYGTAQALATTGIFLSTVASMATTGALLLLFRSFHGG
jgi:predicted permease